MPSTTTAAATSADRLLSRPSEDGWPIVGRGISALLLQLLHQLTPARDEPVGTGLHLRTHLDAAVADEGAGGRAGVHVRGAVSDHNHGLVAFGLLQLRHDGRLAAALRGRRGAVED